MLSSLVHISPYLLAGHGVSGLARAGMAPPQPRGVDVASLLGRDGFDEGVEEAEAAAAAEAEAAFDAESEEAEDFRQYAKLRPDKAAAMMTNAPAAAAKTTKKAGEGVAAADALKTVGNGMFERDFLKFCRYLRNKVHERHPANTFRAINRYEVLRDLGGYIAVAVAYALLWTQARPWFSVWAFPLFLAALFVYRREQLVHGRMHYIRNLTDWPWLDLVVDGFLIVLTGISVQAFYRRHIDEHLSFVSNYARVFGDDWQPFDDLPAIFWVKPWKLFTVAFDSARVKRDGFHRGHMIWEGVAVHLYLAALVAELVWARSCFLLVFHLIPYLLTATARLTTGMLTHSGLDPRNSFNSCGLFDERDARGLFRIMVWLVNLLSDGTLTLHPIHHGYSQAPVSTIQPMVAEINAHCRRTYRGVRYNRVLSHEVHANLLARLPPPRWYHYPIQFLVDLAALGLACTTILGSPIPPILFELAVVDYRVFFVSTALERSANLVQVWDSVQLQPRAKAMRKHNSYLDFVLARYARMSADVQRAGIKTRPGGTPCAPAFVYSETGLPVPDGAVVQP